MCLLSSAERERRMGKLPLSSRGRGVSRGRAKEGQDDGLPGGQ